VIARVLMPGDVFRHMSGPASWALSLGLAGYFLRRRQAPPTAHPACPATRGPAHRVSRPAGSGPCSYAPLPVAASANNPSYC
jgi:hypothetical protein